MMDQIIHARGLPGGQRATEALRSPAPLNKVEDVHAPELYADAVQTVSYPLIDPVSILERLNEVSTLQDLDALVSKCLDLLIAACAGTAAIFYLYDAEAGDFILTAVRGNLDITNLIGLRLKKNQSVVGEAITSEAPVVYGPLVGGSLFNDPHWLSAVYTPRAAPLASTLILPMVREKDLFGAVQLIDYTIADLRLLRAGATRMVHEIERVAVLTLEKEASRRLNSLIDILRDTSRTLDRSLLFQNITERAAQLVDAERASLFLVDTSNQGIGLNVSYQSPHPAAPGVESAAYGGTASSILYPVMARQWRRAAYPAQPESSGGFGFITRSAVTVPMRSATNAGERPETRRVIGGLMALNKLGAAFDEEDVHLLEVLADQAGSIMQMAELSENASELYLDVIQALVASLDAKDPYTQGHSQRVMEYAVALAREMNVSPEGIADIRIASLLHDVGKIGITDQILRKIDGLTPAEYETIKKHPAIGGNIMKQVRVLESVLPGIVEHHERLDGSGYPLGLVGKNISLMGRIIAIADVFDAMTSDRPYRPALSRRTVLQHLRANAGLLYDPDGVEAFTRLVEAMEDPIRA